MGRINNLQILFCKHLQQEWHLLSFTEFTKELAKKKVKHALADEADWEDYFNEQKQKA